MYQPINFACDIFPLRNLLGIWFFEVLTILLVISKLITWLLASYEIFFVLDTLKTVHRWLPTFRVGGGGVPEFFDKGVLKSRLLLDVIYERPQWRVTGLNLKIKVRLNPVKSSLTLAYNINIAIINISRFEIKGSKKLKDKKLTAQGIGINNRLKNAPCMSTYKSTELSIMLVGIMRNSLNNF